MPNALPPTLLKVVKFGDYFSLEQSVDVKTYEDVTVRLPKINPVRWELLKSLKVVNLGESSSLEENVHMKTIGVETVMLQKINKVCIINKTMQKVNSVWREQWKLPK